MTEILAECGNMQQERNEFLRTRDRDMRQIFEAANPGDRHLMIRGLLPVKIGQEMAKQSGTTKNIAEKWKQWRGNMETSLGVDLFDPQAAARKHR